MAAQQTITERMRTTFDSVSGIFEYYMVTIMVCQGRDKKKETSTTMSLYNSSF